MATIKYYLRNQSIYMRFNLTSTTKLQLTTGLKIEPKQWNVKDGLPKRNSADNKQILNTLQSLERFVYDSYVSDIANNVSITTDWLKGLFDNFFNKKTLPLFTDYIQKYIDNAPFHKNQKNGIGINHYSIRIYKYFLNYFLKFEKTTRKKYALNDVNNTCVDNFRNYLLKEGFSANSINLYMSKFKVICNYIDSQGYSVNVKTSNLKLAYNKKKSEDIITLSFEELDKIASIDLPPNLHVYRQWLLLGCEVGQRASDLLNLTYDKIKGNGEHLYFEILQSKTNKVVFVPLTKRAKKIIKDFPKPIIYSAFLYNIKNICKLAGINKEIEYLQIKNNDIHSSKITMPKYKAIGTHTCRRSFATNYYGKIPTPLIKSITGHSTEEMLLAYIGKTADDNLRMLFGIYEKLNI